MPPVHPPKTLDLPGWLHPLSLRTAEMDGTGHPRRILLADCDSYFVRCAILADPEGAGRAELLIVGGRADGRGVVTSASYAARRYGVHAGMPSSQALRLCPGAMIVPVPGEMVSRKHHEVRAVLDRFSPVVSAASVDEFYLDLTGTERLYRDEPLEETARRIQAAVMDETGIAISVGGATQRILAKMAASVNKPMGVFVVPPGGEEEFMLRFGLADIPGVGPSFQEALRRRGAVSVRDVAQLGEDTLVAWAGESRGRWLYDVVHGRDPSRVHERPPQKSVSHERTFHQDISDDDELDARLLSLVTETGAALREGGNRGRTVTVKVRAADFTDRSMSRTLPEPLESDRALYTVARELLHALRARSRGGVRLLHVGVSRLSVGAEDEPLTFFGPDASLESERDRKLSGVSDRLRERFGKGAIVPGRIAPPPAPRD
jgi:DNA polymerase-4